MLKQESILQSITNNKSYIISGIGGSGKTTLAYEIVKQSIDTKYIHTFPENYPDLIVLTGGSVEDVMGLLKKLNNKPYYTKHYVILDRIDKMSIEAQNLLLKVIEERDIMFVITTNNNAKTLKTIFSRTISLTPNLFTVEELVEILQAKFPDENKESLLEISNLSNGSLGKVLNYLNNQNLKEFIKDLNSSNMDGLVLSTKIEKDRENIFEYFFLLENFIRNKMLVSKETTKYFNLILEIEKYKKHLNNNVNLKMILRNIFYQLNEI